MPFRHRVTARFCDIDRAGVVFFGRFFEFCHAALEECLVAMFGPLEESFRRGAWMMPVVHSAADYLLPVRLGEVLDVALRIERVGRSSLAVGYTIEGPDGTLRARVRLVHVFVEPERRVKVPVPAAFRAALAAQGLTVGEGEGEA